MPVAMLTAEENNTKDRKYFKADVISAAKFLIVVFSPLVANF